jgi:hypothetical protein
VLKFLFITSFITLNHWVSSQAFTFKNSISIKDKNQIWMPDNTGNIYLYGADILEKKSAGQLPSFSQSIKSMGEIDEILPINALKTYLFSESQQQLCLIDNTLSIQSSCMDLEEYEIQYALRCAISGRPDLVYIYDQFNSTLFLLNTKTKTIIQKVPNLEGLLNQELEIVELKEYENDLFIRTATNKVYQLDMFLNLKKQLPEPHKCLIFYKGSIVDKDNTQLIFTHLESNEKKVIPLDKISASELKIIGNSFYFSTKFEIKIYEYNPD